MDHSTMMIARPKKVVGIILVLSLVIQQWPLAVPHLRLSDSRHTVPPTQALAPRAVFQRHVFVHRSAAVSRHVVSLFERHGVSSAFHGWLDFIHPRTHDFSHHIADWYRKDAHLRALKRPYRSRYVVLFSLLVLQSIISFVQVQTLANFMNGAMSMNAQWPHGAPLSMAQHVLLMGKQMIFLSVIARMLQGLTDYLFERVRQSLIGDFQRFVNGQIARRDIHGPLSPLEDLRVVAFRCLDDTGDFARVYLDTNLRKWHALVDLLLAYAFMCRLSVPTAEYVLLAAVIFAILWLPYQTKMKKNSTLRQEFNGRSQSVTQAILHPNRFAQMRIQGEDQILPSILNPIAEARKRLNLKIAKFHDPYVTGLDLLSDLLFNQAILWCGIRSLLLTGAPGLGTVIALTEYGRRLRSSFKGIFDQFDGGAQAAAKLNWLGFRIRPVDDPSKSKSIPMSAQLDGTILVHQVSYEGILKNVSLSIEAGDVIELKAQNGWGKSTLIKLMSGLYQPSSGDVLLKIGIPGKAAQMVSPYSMPEYLRNQVSWVSASPQPIDPVLSLDGKSSELTLRRILMSDPSLPRNLDIVAVLTDYDAQWTIDPSQLDAPFDPDRQFSDGQRMRMALAKAFLRKPRILFLDEPSGNLDASARANLNKTLEYLKARKGTPGQMTVIIVSFTSIEMKHQVVDLSVFAPPVVKNGFSTTATPLRPLESMQQRSSVGTIHSLAAIIHRLAPIFVHSKVSYALAGAA